MIDEKEKKTVENQMCSGNGEEEIDRLVKNDLLK